jgi:hypothetical protein
VYLRVRASVHQAANPESIVDSANFRFMTSSSILNVYTLEILPLTGNLLVAATAP